MRKLYLLVLLSIIFVCPIKAQIILNSGTIAILPGTVHNATASLTGFIVPKADSNHFWNYASLPATGTMHTDYILNPFPGFSASKAAIANIHDSEKITSNNTIYTNDIFDEDTSGIYHAGQYVKAQKFSLYNYFANPKDSLYIPEQSDYYKVNVIGFPAMYHHAYNTKAVKILKFNITAQSLPVPLTKAPGSKNTRIQVRDTIVGWGGLRIPATQKYSATYKVLLVRRKYSAVDSFFINGKPANPIFVQALGMSQGAKTTSYSEYFYRAGSQNPLMTIFFGNDSTYTKPTAVWYSADSIKSGIALSENSLPEFTLYPNPATTGLLHCRLHKKCPEPWTVVVTNTTGQELLKQNITGSDAIDMTMDLSSLPAKGIYFVSIRNEVGEIVGERKFVFIR